ncbi:hypothetical protein GCM10009550_77790 [Actinocorallia libanotica]|uniref:Transposase IS4-like domain-containing protein n=1 Tax=Actinocorallia libanotica TaxID=46162 RepID=A0ABP4CIE4_9ACTN
MCDGRGRSLAFVLTGGNVNDCTRFTRLMDAFRVSGLGFGRLWVRLDRVIGDKGYSTKAIRAHLRCRGIAVTIPERRDQVRDRQWRGSRGGRPPVFDKGFYR